jgi:predicted nucleic-acid-binding protein
MIGLDTNVLVRIVLADDALQTTQALDLLQACDKAGEVIAVTLSVILELEWVLRSAAKLKKPEMIVVFKRLLEIAPLRIENEAVLEHALYLYDGEGAKADFAECLFAAQYQRMGCRTMASFDEKAQRMDKVAHPADISNTV